MTDALKEGLIALRDVIRTEGPVSEPYAVYSAIDLGPGGYARAPARRAKAAIVRTLQRERP